MFFPFLTGHLCGCKKLIDFFHANVWLEHSCFFGRGDGKIKNMDVAFFSILDSAYLKNNNANCFAHCIAGTTFNQPFLLKSILKNFQASFTGKKPGKPIR